MNDKGEAGANRSGKTEIQTSKMRIREPICRRHPQIFGEIRRSRTNRVDPSGKGGPARIRKRKAICAKPSQLAKAKNLEKRSDEVISKMIAIIQ
jgi:hypothetical protein